MTACIVLLQHDQCRPCVHTDAACSGAGFSRQGKYVASWTGGPCKAVSGMQVIPTGLDGLQSMNFRQLFCCFKAHAHVSEQGMPGQVGVIVYGLNICGAHAALH